MKIIDCDQKSPEWWLLKVGKISGTRFGNVLSSAKNRLIYELMNERLDGCLNISDYVSEDMQYGLDNEELALELYSQKEGIEVKKVGAIISDFCPIHMASPDGMSLDNKIAQEVKCTQNGYTHIQRVFEGVDVKYLPQCINYFAISDEVEEVHFISFCGYREERPIHVIKLKRADYQKQIDRGRIEVLRIEQELNRMIDEYTF